MSIRLVISMLVVAMFVSLFSGCPAPQETLNSDDYQFDYWIGTSSKQFPNKTIVEGQVEKLRNGGFFGQHQLVSFHVDEDVIAGRIAGRFFLASGNVNGSFGAADQLKFGWNPQPSHTTISMVPISKLDIVDVNIAVPTIQFKFAPKLNPYLAMGGSYEPNEVIATEHLIRATIRISPRDRSREKFLPQ